MTTYMLRGTPAPSVMLIGTGTLFAGVTAVLVSLWTDSPIGFFLGTAIAGVGFGAGFQGGIRLVAPLAHPDQRAGCCPCSSPSRTSAWEFPPSPPVWPSSGAVAWSPPATVRPGRPPPRRPGHRQPGPPSFPHPTIDQGGLPMTDTRSHKTPGPDHPITLERSPSHVVVRSGCDRDRRNRPGPRDARGHLPAPFSTFRSTTSTSTTYDSDQHSWCPYKGEASYYDIVDGDGTDLSAAVWYYADPFPAVARIKGHVAFYANRVDITATSGPTRHTIDRPSEEEAASVSTAPVHD